MSDSDLATVIYWTEEEVWERIRAIYAKHPILLDYPLADWCTCCYEMEVGELHGHGSDIHRDWEELETAFFLLGIKWDHPGNDQEDA